MERATVAVYEERGPEWAASHAHPGRRAEAESFAARVDGGAVRADVGCGAGRYAPHLGGPLLCLDASATMIRHCRIAVPEALYVQGDVEHLPFRTRGVRGAWSSMTYLHLPRTRLPRALWDLHRVLAVGAPFAMSVLVGDYEGTALPDDDVGERYFAGWRPADLADVVTGAGFEIDGGSPVVADDEVRLSATRANTLADTVGPGMRLLVCGLNPSVYAADAGVAFARPGNRFWPAAVAAGLVSSDRDPLAALAAGVGLTDIVKRATPAASELTPAEYRHGLARVGRLVAWLVPRAVCVVGLAGWRSAVDPAAVAGLQPQRLGGRPVYLMPSTSGRNGRSTPRELARHLAAAAAIADDTPLEPEPIGPRPVQSGPNPDQNPAGSRQV